MKKNKFTNVLKNSFFLFLSAAFIFSSCANNLNDEKTDVSENLSRALSPSKSITVNVLDVPDTVKNCNVWAWEPSSNTDYSSKGWPGNLSMRATTIEGFSAFTYTFNIDSKYDLGILFVSSTGSPQTSDIKIPKEEFVSNTEFYFVWDVGEYYTKLSDCVGVKSASISDVAGNKISIKVSLLKEIVKDKLSVKDSEGNTLNVESADIDEIILSKGDINNIPYTLSYDDGPEITAQISSEVIDNLYGSAASEINDLGVTINSDGTATFKTWAPVATKVYLLLYESAEKAGESTKDYECTGSTTKDLGTPVSEEGIPMTFDSTTGVWTAENISINGAKYYKYKITNNGKVYYVCDINAKAASADSIASQIVDINAGTEYGTKENYKNPFGSDENENKKYTDAVIYEMHIRDWSMGFKTGSLGKFDDITEALGENGSGEFAKHLKDLGITHVQILPMFDYAQTTVNEAYNWGYNPYHYNVPEGRYVNYGADKDGMDAVNQMRKMIKAFHDAGIAVNMDVVYNHTSSTGEGSLYDSTVPEYFYRMNEDGTYSNGSGCGNEVATNHAMVKKYVIDSLKHWMLDYHINGFRFDLMGLHETDTMKEIYDALSEIDPNVMVYGEPWTGGTSPVEPSTRKPYIDDCASSSSVNGVACFNDDIRDAVKGSDAFGFYVGHIQGTYNNPWISAGLSGSLLSRGGFTENQCRTINYVECHDNYTFYDKLVFSALSEQGLITIGSENNFSSKFRNPSAKELELIKKQEKLGAAYIILAQGIPFINGGQEFCRTKKGNPDSYASDTKGGKEWSESELLECNTIKLSRKNEFPDVYNIYKGLIKLRKANPESFGANENASCVTIADGITKYTTGDFTVIFNATDKDFSPVLMGANSTVSLIFHNYDIENGISGKLVTINEETGEVTTASEESVVSTVPAKSFVILTK